MEKPHLKLEKNGENILNIFADLRESNSPLEALKKLRKIFPELDFIQAKEVMILHETDYNDLDEYQKAVFDQLKGQI